MPDAAATQSCRPISLHFHALSKLTALSPLALSTSLVSHLASKSESGSRLQGVLHEAAALHHLEPSWIRLRRDRFLWSPGSLAFGASHLDIPLMWLSLTHTPHISMTKPQLQQHPLLHFFRRKVLFTFKHKKGCPCSSRGLKQLKQAGHDYGSLKRKCHLHGGQRLPPKG